MSVFIYRSVQTIINLHNSIAPNILGQIFILDEDVLDTWFSSGIFPFSIFGWPQQVSNK